MTTKPPQPDDPLPEPYQLEIRTYGDHQALVQALVLYRRRCLGKAGSPKHSMYREGYYQLADRTEKLERRVVKSFLKSIGYDVDAIMARAKAKLEGKAAE